MLSMQSAHVVGYLTNKRIKHKIKRINDEITWWRFGADQVMHGLFLVIIL